MKTTCTLLAALLLGPLAVLHAAESELARPNIVIIFIDDLGYGDIGPFGATKQRTPNLDRMAREGMKLTSFYAAPVCSVVAGAAAHRLLRRARLRAGRLWTGRRNGLHPAEFTIAERLKEQGYATACVGKWHRRRSTGVPAHAAGL